MTHSNCKSGLCRKACRGRRRRRLCASSRSCSWPSPSSTDSSSAPSSPSSSADSVVISFDDRSLRRRDIRLEPHYPWRLGRARDGYSQHPQLGAGAQFGHAPQPVQLQVPATQSSVSTAWLRSGPGRGCGPDTYSVRSCGACAHSEAGRCVRRARSARSVRRRSEPLSTGSAVRPRASDTTLRKRRLGLTIENCAKLISQQSAVVLSIIICLR